MSQRTITRARFNATVRRLELSYTQGYCARPGSERHYKEPGKKLTMRSAYEILEAEHLKAHSRREYERLSAEDAKKMEAYYRDVMEQDGYEPEFEAHWNRVHSLTKQLPARHRRAVERALLLRELELAPNPDYLRPPVRRVYDATLEAWGVERAMEWDRKTLANAY